MFNVQLLELSFGGGGGSCEKSSERLDFVTPYKPPVRVKRRNKSLFLIIIFVFW